jgi:sec-independent protein translocase protein TatA
MPQIGPAEILVILLVGLLVFGPHRLPEIGRQVGKGMRELRKFQDTVRGELDEVLHLHEHDSPPPLPEAAPPPAGASADAGAGITAAGTTTPGAPSEAPPARAPSRFRAPGTPSGA